MSHQPTTNSDVEHDSSLQADFSTKMAIFTLSFMEPISSVLSKCKAKKVLSGKDIFFS